MDSDSVEHKKPSRTPGLSDVDPELSQGMVCIKFATSSVSSVRVQNMGVPRPISGTPEMDVTATPTEVEVEAPTLAQIISARFPPQGNWNRELLLVDCRRFIDYNTSHIRSAINICCSKLVRRRLQENKMNALDLLLQQLSACGLPTSKEQSDNLEIILYDQDTVANLQSLQQTTKGGTVIRKMSEPLKVVDSSMTGLSLGCSKGGSSQSFPVLKMKKGACGGNRRGSMDDSTFVNLLIDKLSSCPELASVKILKGGFLDFQSRYPELCEGSAPVGGIQATPGRGASARLSLTSLSQPCMPVSNQGPTRILPFLYLGSQQDALDMELLKKHNIHYVVNLSISCPRPEFLVEENFLRIPVNDSYTEKLLPHFEQAFEFLDKVRESNASVLIHCLAGISRSPTLAIAYIMRHLHMQSEEAYRYIKEKRPSISPNFNFLGQLLEYEKQLKARRGKEVEEQLKGSLRKVLVPPFLSPRPATARQVSEHKTTAILSRTNSLPIEYPGMKRSFSCPVKIQRLGDSPTSIERSNIFFGHSPSNERNTNGKRQMRPSEMAATTKEEEISEMDTTTSATPPTAIFLPSKDSAVPVWPKNIFTDMIPPDVPAPLGPPSSLVQRPRGLGLVRSRCALSIPQPVQEDLPSPSTELVLSFGGSLHVKEIQSPVTEKVAPPLASTAWDPQPPAATTPGQNSSEKKLIPATPTVLTSTPRAVIDSTSATKLALNPDKVQRGDDVGDAGRQADADPQPILQSSDTYKTGAKTGSRTSGVCAVNPFFAAMAACGGNQAVTSISPEFETPPTPISAMPFKLPPTAKSSPAPAGGFGRGIFNRKGCEPCAGKETDSDKEMMVMMETETENKRDSGFGQLVLEEDSGAELPRPAVKLTLTQPTPSPVVTEQPQFIRARSGEPASVSLTTKAMSATNPLFADQSPARKTPKKECPPNRPSEPLSRPGGDGLMTKITARRAASADKSKSGRIGDGHTSVRQRMMPKMFRKPSWANVGINFFGAAAVSAPRGSGFENHPSSSGTVFGNYYDSLGGGGSGASTSTGMGVAKSATSGGISERIQLPGPPKSKSETHLLYPNADLDSPESGFVESPLRDQAPTSPYNRDPDTTSIGSASSLEIAVN